MTPSSGNMLSLTLETEGRSVPLNFPVRRMVNAGYVGRDQATVRAHIEEMRHLGIPAPTSVPVFFMLTADNLTTADQIDVIGTGTSGEVEYVLLLHEDEVFVGVGSDHTDRALEGASIGKSKQVCKNVVSSRVWRYRDVKDGWDDLQLTSWVRSPNTGLEVVYQQGSLGTILSADELLDRVRSRIKDDCCEGLVIFSGTLPLVAGSLIYTPEFRCELLDLRTGRSLSCAYRAVPLYFFEGADE
jgi:hypothetical protein